MSTTLGYIECISLWCLSPLGSHGITTKPKNTTGFVLAKCSSRHRTLLVQSIYFVHTHICFAQSTFTFLSVCNALLLESVPATVFVEHKPLGAACSNSMPGTAGTVQPLDWTFTWNAICADQVWSWIRHESRSLALTACKLVLFWGTLRESIFHCLRHVLASSIC